MTRPKLPDLHVGLCQLPQDPCQQLRRGRALEEGWQQTRPVRRDHEPACPPGPEPHQSPGQPSKLLGTVEKEDVPGAKAPDYVLIHLVQPGMGLSKRDRPHPEPPGRDPRSEIFQKRGLAMTVRPDDRPTPTQGREAVQKVLPGHS